MIRTHYAIVGIILDGYNNPVSSIFYTVIKGNIA